MIFPSFAFNLANRNASKTTCKVIYSDITARFPGRVADVIRKRPAAPDIRDLSKLYGMGEHKCPMVCEMLLKEYDLKKLRAIKRSRPPQVYSKQWNLLCRWLPTT